MEKIKNAIRTIPNWPKKGIMFRDITTLLLNPKAYIESLDELEKLCKNLEFDSIAAVESRGFIFGSVLAERLKKKLILVRKPGKLPAETMSESYEKEYGPDSVEIHIDAIEKDEKVLIVDDLIATGGTVIAVANLIEKMHANVAAMIFVIGLSDLIPAELKEKYKILTLIDYEGE